MKQCPVCNAMCFDDMGVCYACLHRFDEGGEGQAPYEQIEEAIGASRLLQQGSVQVEGKAEAKACEKVEMEACEKERARRPKHAPSGAAQGHNVIIEHVDIAETGALDPETWTFRLSIPANCKGVALRLERAGAQG